MHGMVFQPINMKNEQNITGSNTLTEDTPAPADNAPGGTTKPAKKMTRRVLIGGGIGTLAVAGVGAGWAYNRYLAEHTQIEDTLAYESAQQSKNNPSGAADPTELTGVSITDSGLTAQEGSITLKSYTEGNGNNAVVSFTAEVKLNNATLLRSAFANNKFGQNIIDTPPILPRSTTVSGP